MQSTANYPAHVPSVIRQFVDHDWTITGHDADGHGRYRVEANGFIARVWSGVDGDYSYVVMRDDEELTTVENGWGKPDIASAMKAAEAVINA